jgi:hypothetical protein
VDKFFRVDKFCFCLQGECVNISIKLHKTEDSVMVHLHPEKTRRERLKEASKSLDKLPVLDEKNKNTSVIAKLGPLEVKGACDMDNPHFARVDPI